MALPTPQGKQAEVLCLPEQGHYVVLGTAGSGKTTMAIHRAASLADSVASEGKKVLIVTFNKALVTYLSHISDEMLQNVDVHNYHRFARGYLGHRGILGYHDIVSRAGTKLRFIKAALKEVVEEEGVNSTLSRAPEVFYEEICWMQKMGLTELDQYVEVDRVGRAGTRITRENRKYFFSVYEKYLEIRECKGYRYDWDDIAQTVKSQFEEDEEERVYKHIVIDEGQDLSPEMLRSLALAIPADGSITFFGDVAQQIYGSRISWRSAGLKVKKGEMWSFDRNYRNSKEIADLAIAISELPFFDKDVDIVTPKSPTASGPKPGLVRFTEPGKELEWVIQAAQKVAKNETVAILVRTRKDVKHIIRLLEKNGTPTQELHGDMFSWNSRPGISVGTYHSAKGLEFDTVLLPYCSKGRLPDPERVIALEDEEETISEEAKLIYVAVTRARRRLVLTFTGALTEIVPRDRSLYHISEG